MAGSYEHIIHGWSLIENMGDAHEAVEELMWLIESQIGLETVEMLLDTQYYPMMRGEIPKDATMQTVDLMMKS